MKDRLAHDTGVLETEADPPGACWVAIPGKAGTFIRSACPMEIPQVHTITAAWIHQFATDRHGWTAAQIRALGLRYPQTVGWIYDLDGTEISDEAAREFERARDVFSSAKAKRKSKRRQVFKIAYASSQRQREAARPGPVTYDDPPW